MRLVARRAEGTERVAESLRRERWCLLSESRLFRAALERRKLRPLFWVSPEKTPLWRHEEARFEELRDARSEALRRENRGPALGRVGPAHDGARVVVREQRRRGLAEEALGRLRETSHIDTRLLERHTELGGTVSSPLCVFERTIRSQRRHKVSKIGVNAEPPIRSLPSYTHSSREPRRSSSSSSTHRVSTQALKTPHSNTSEVRRCVARVGERARGARLLRGQHARAELRDCAEEPAPTIVLATAVGVPRRGARVRYLAQTLYECTGGHQSVERRAPGHVHAVRRRQRHGERARGSGPREGQGGGFAAAAAAAALSLSLSLSLSLEQPREREREKGRRVSWSQTEKRFTE